jgi:hypothetical protein
MPLPGHFSAQIYSMRKMRRNCRMVSVLLAGIELSCPRQRTKLLPQLLTRTGVLIRPCQVTGFTSERWPASIGIRIEARPQPPRDGKDSVRKPFKYGPALPQDASRCNKCSRQLTYTVR